MSRESFIREEPARDDKCPYFAKCRRYAEDTLGVAEYLDHRFSCCFCEDCCARRHVPNVYFRRRPRCKIAPPKGWVRLGLQCDAKHPFTKEALRDWHYSYHGTNPEAVKGILYTRDLLKPGDVRPNGQAVAVPHGHYSSPCYFTSPTVAYAGRPVYAKMSEYPGGGSCQVAVALRQRPGSYRTGRATTWWPENGDFRDHEVEWYSNWRASVFPTGLLVRISEEPVYSEDLVTASLSGNIAEVKRLIALNRGFTSPGTLNTVLHELAYEAGVGIGDDAAAEVATLLLEAGCAAMQTDRNGETALQVMRRLDGHRRSPKLAHLLEYSEREEQLAADSRSMISLNGKGARPPPRRLIVYQKICERPESHRPETEEDSELGSISTPSALRPSVSVDQSQVDPVPYLFAVPQGSDAEPFSRPTSLWKDGPRGQATHVDPLWDPHTSVSSCD